MKELRKIASIETHENVRIEYETANVGSRMLAYLLDKLIVDGTLFLTVLVLVILALNEVIEADLGGLVESLTGNLYVYIAVYLLVSFLLENFYFIFFERVLKGQSPGKKAARIRVVMTTGEPVSFIASVVRNFFRIADELPASNLLGGVLVFFGKNSQRLGDRIANTMVIKYEKLKNFSKYIEELAAGAEKMSASADTAMSREAMASSRVADGEAMASGGVAGGEAMVSGRVADGETMGSGAARPAAESAARIADRTFEPEKTLVREYFARQKTIPKKKLEETGVLLFRTVSGKMRKLSGEEYRIEKKRIPLFLQAFSLGEDASAEFTANCLNQYCIGENPGAPGIQGTPAGTPGAPETREIPDGAPGAPETREIPDGTPGAQGPLAAGTPGAQGPLAAGTPGAQTIPAAEQQAGGEGNVNGK